MPLRLLPTLLLLSACFPTLHNARVEPGLRLDAGLTLLTDQPREGREQGSDGILTLAPVVGIRDRVEIGLPIGVYWEEGPALSGAIGQSETEELVLAPYVKVALLPSGGRDHLAVFGQAAVFLPGSVGLRYGRDLGTWEPHVGITWIFSGGPAGDSPIITRYQQRDQSLLLGSFGATLNAKGKPAVEVGVLRNSYVEPTFEFGDIRRTQYDVFVGMRVGVSRKGSWTGSIGEGPP